MESDGSTNMVRLVRDLMKVGVPTCRQGIPVPELARLMLEKSFEAVVVLDEESGHVLGVVSQRELVSAYSRDDHRELMHEQYT